MGKRWAIWGPVALAGVLLVTVGAWWALAASNTDPAPPPASAPSVSVTPTGDAEEAAAALLLLTTEPEALVPDALRGELGGDLADAVPEGTEVVADPGRWRPSTAGGGVIEVILNYPDGTSETLDVVMLEEDGQWKVLQTFPAGTVE